MTAAITATAAATSAGHLVLPPTTAITTTGLTKRFGAKDALRDVDLTVEPGTIFGCLGPNGAGKTTLIRLVAGLARPTSGRVEVFEVDVARGPEWAQSHLGYLPGDFVAPPAMTARRYLTHMAALRGGDGATAIERLAERLGLDLGGRIGAMSHGNRQKVGIVQAFMHDPALLLLDEPTAGLDPLVQREFLAMIREARDREHTVFLSSHVLSEVQSVADTVGMLRDGTLVTVDSVATLRAAAAHRLVLVFEGAPPLDVLRTVPGVRAVEPLADTDGRGVRLVVDGSAAALLRAAAPFGIEHVETHEPDLEDVFLACYGSRP